MGLVERREKKCINNKTRQGVERRDVINWQAFPQGFF